MIANITVKVIFFWIFMGWHSSPTHKYSYSYLNCFCPLSWRLWVNLLKIDFSVSWGHVIRRAVEKFKSLFVCLTNLLHKIIPHLQYIIPDTYSKRKSIFPFNFSANCISNSILNGTEYLINENCILLFHYSSSGLGYSEICSKRNVLLV